MAYSVKKAGVQFYITVDTGADLIGAGSNFSLVVRNNDNGDTSTGITTGSFTELSESAGTYQAAVTIANAGDYTVIIKNPTNNLGNITAPLIITNATIDDIYQAVDTLESISTNIFNEVQNLDGDSIAAVQASISNLSEEIESISGLLANKTALLTFSSTDESANIDVGTIVTGQDSSAVGRVETVTVSGGDTVVKLSQVIGEFTASGTAEQISGDGGTTTSGIDSVVYGNTATDTLMEFVEEINATLNSEDGLAVISGYTDDIENMLNGTEYLKDGSTPNPFYDATNPGVAKESTAVEALATLQAAITTAENNVNSHTDLLVGANSDTATGTLFGDLYLLKQVVDANRTHLEDSGYGLGALETLLNSVESTLGSPTDNAGGNTVYSKIADVTSELGNGVYGLSAIKTFLESMDDKLDSIEGKVDDIIQGAAGARVFV
jgi:hypothetical protein